MKKLLSIIVLLLLLPVAASSYTVCTNGVASAPVTGRSQTGDLGVLAAPQSQAAVSGQLSGSLGAVGALSSDIGSALPGQESFSGNIGTVASFGSDRAGAAVLSPGIGLVAYLDSALTTSTGGGGGGPVAVSDDFNRSNGALGANWAQLTGTYQSFTVLDNHDKVATTNQTAGNYWSANTFNANHYSESQYGDCAVRMQSDAHSCYHLRVDTVDEGDGYMTVFYYLYKIVAGTATQIGSWGYDSGGTGTPFSGVFRLEANGTTISFKTAASHGGTYTSRISVTDASLSGGAPGIYYPSDQGLVVTDDNWYGGDL